MEFLSAGKLKEAMINRCCGNSELARRAGIPLCIVTRLLKRNSRVNLSTLGKLSSALQVPYHNLIVEGN